MVYCWGYQVSFWCTLPKFNIAPEKLPKPNRKGLSSNHPFFRGELLNFGGVSLGYHVALWNLTRYDYDRIATTSRVNRQPITAGLNMKSNTASLGWIIVIIETGVFFFGAQNVYVFFCESLTSPNFLEIKSFQLFWFRSMLCIAKQVKKIRFWMSENRVGGWKIHLEKKNELN